MESPLTSSPRLPLTSPPQAENKLSEAIFYLVADKHREVQDTRFGRQGSCFIDRARQAKNAASMALVNWVGTIVMKDVDVLLDVAFEAPAK